MKTFFLAKVHLQTVSSTLPCFLWGIRMLLKECCQSFTNPRIKLSAKRTIKSTRLSDFLTARSSPKARGFSNRDPFARFHSELRPRVDPSGEVSHYRESSPIAPQPVCAEQT